MNLPKDQQVRYWLHQALVRDDAPRDPEVIHASDLTDENFCAREQVLRRLTGKGYDRPVTAALSMVYHLGRNSQALLTNLLAVAGVVVGNWRCRTCNHLEEFRGPVSACPECDSDQVVYEEMRFTSKANGASCGVDVLFRPPGAKKLIVVEIKGYQKDDFKKLVMPLWEHRLRTALYLRIIAESDHPAKNEIDTAQARVLYMCKDGYGQQDEDIKDWRLGDGKWSPFKEYVVDRDDESTEYLAQLAARVTQFRKEGVMPYGVCPTQFVRRAKGCAVVHECFGGKYPATEDPTAGMRPREAGQ